MKLRRPQARQRPPHEPHDANSHPSFFTRASSQPSRPKPKTNTRKRKGGGPDVVIAVMGVTGAGKSSFIATVTGRKDIQVGHDLNSGRECP
jgi:ribosome biogenesis GTPase A